MFFLLEMVMSYGATTWQAGRVYTYNGRHPCRRCNAHGWTLDDGYPECPVCKGACFYNKRTFRIITMAEAQPPLCTIGDLFGNLLEKARPK